jgi:hypothetical protein
MSSVSLERKDGDPSGIFWLATGLTKIDALTSLPVRHQHLAPRPWEDPQDAAEEPGGDSRNFDRRFHSW